MSYIVYHPLSGQKIDCIDEQSVISSVLSIQQSILEAYPISILNNTTNASGDTTWIKSTLIVPSINLVSSTTIPSTII